MCLCGSACDIGAAVSVNQGRFPPTFLSRVLSDVSETFVESHFNSAAESESPLAVRIHPGINFTIGGNLYVMRNVSNDLLTFAGTISPLSAARDLRSGTCGGADTVQN